MGVFSIKKSDKKDQNSGSGKRRIPRTVMESIPYKSIYSSGIMEDYDGRFSKTYRLKETNFDVEEESKQENMILAYERMLNSIGEDMIGQLTIINRPIDQDVVRNSILMRPKKDGLNRFRTEWNDMFLEKLSAGKNNLTKDKLFTVSVAAPDAAAAADILKRTDHSITKDVRRINRQDTKALTIGERMDTFYGIYHGADELAFTKRTAPLMKDGKLDLDLMARHGMGSKELIAPDSMDIKSNQLVFGDSRYARAFYLDHLPTQLSTSLLNDITDLPCNMIASVTFVQMDQEKGRQMIQNEVNGTNAQINTRQAEAANMGVMNAGVVSTELENARDQAVEMLNDVIKRNQKIFQVTCVIVLFADSKEGLDRQTGMLKTTVRGHLCALRAMNHQQEQYFNTALPLAAVPAKSHRILTSESAAVFMPFSVQDMNHLDGIWYGTNPLSGNMIRYNRKTGANYNAVYLGGSGTGKSFLIKEEISQTALDTGDAIIIIDPEGEYVPLGEAFGATIIDLSLDGKNHINPLDMDVQFGGEGENPIPMKCDAIESLVESMVGGADSLSPVEKSIIHRVGKMIYRGYYQHMQEMAHLHGITCDTAAAPTLQDFYAELCNQREPQAQYLATAIEPYCVGNYAVFAERTNVNTNNRIIVYDLSKMTSGMKEVAMHVCMNDSWNRIIKNGSQGVFTRLYVDEFHLFTKTRTSAAFMKNIYKRARKWKGMPSAITQNVSDMFVNEEAEAILKNSSFIVMMGQSPTDQIELQNLYHISSQMLTFITDQPPGNGLIYNGTTLVPLEGDFPEHTEMYRLMDSKKGEKKKEE